MAETDELNVRLIADNSNFIPKFTQAENSVQSLDKAVNILKTGLATLGVGAFLKSSWSAYGTQIEQETKLANVMRQRLGASQAEINSVKELASEQQRLGVVGDEVQLAGAQQLSLYTKQTDSIKKLIPAMNDLIVQQNGLKASTGSAESVASQLGKALQGEITMLKRNGIEFSEAEKNILKYGNEQERVAVLVNAVEKKVGGLNAELKATPAGQIASLANDFGDLKEQVGETIAPIALTLVPLLSQAIYDLAPVLNTLRGGILVVTNAFNSLTPELRQAITYTLLAAIAAKTLTAAFGGVGAAAILVGGIILAMLGSSKNAADLLNASMEDAFGAANSGAESAASGVDDLNESLGETKKALGGLAGFDEITKLGGGSGAFSGLKADAADALEEYQKLMDAADNARSKFDMSGIPPLDFSKLLEGASEVIEDIKKLFSFNPTEMFKGLYDLNEKIRSVFGDDWTDFWMDAGAVMAAAFNGADISTDQLIDFRDKCYAIFGEGWTDFWMRAGESINNIVTLILDGSNKLSKGDFSGWAADWSRAAAQNPFMPDDMKKVLTVQARAQENGMTVSEYLGMVSSSTHTSDASARRGGVGAERYEYVPAYGMPSSVPYDDISFRQSEQREFLRKRDIYDAQIAAMRSSGNRQGMPSSVTAIFNLDGEEFARATAGVDSDQTTITGQ